MDGRYFRGFVTFGRSLLSGVVTYGWPLLSVAVTFGWPLLSVAVTFGGRYFRGRYFREVVTFGESLLWGGRYYFFFLHFPYPRPHYFSNDPFLSAPDSQPEL